MGSIPQEAETTASCAEPLICREHFQSFPGLSPSRLVILIPLVEKEDSFDGRTEAAGRGNKAAQLYFLPSQRRSLLN